MLLEVLRLALTSLILGCVTISGAAARQSVPPDHSLDRCLDRALKRHVHVGLVDYSAMKVDADFTAAMTALAALDPVTVVTRAEQMAFWINAYNALVIKKVLDNYPIGSVTEVGPAGRWSFFKSTEFVIGGKKYTLDHIEHEIIRTRFEDPRAHFALVCGSLGCPALRAGVWEADRLEADLDDAARVFVNDPSKVQVDPEGGVLRLSRIFEWYKADFEKSAGSVISFLRRYRKDAAIPDGLRIEYLDYSWSLNEWKGSHAPH